MVMLAIARAVDLLTTRMASPDLSKELNPLVRWFGWKWTILLNILIVLMSPAFSHRLYACCVILSFAAAGWNVVVYVIDTWIGNRH